MEANGFFYEMRLANGITVSDKDFEELQRNIKQIIKQKQPFERLTVNIYQLAARCSPIS